MADQVAQEAAKQALRDALAAMNAALTQAAEVGLDVDMNHVVQLAQEGAARKIVLRAHIRESLDSGS